LDAVKIFPDDFVPNIEGHTYHPKWVKANPVEATKWKGFRDAAIAYKKGDVLVPPSMATKYGKALVAAGKSHMSVVDLGAVWTPPNSPGGTPPSGYHWLADFSSGTQDFSMFDTHDANLGSTVNDPIHGTTRGCTVVPKPSNSGVATWSNFMCRVVVSQNFGSSSSTGAITFLWEPGAYGNSWEQQGAHTWFRLIFLIPDGSNVNYPGFLNASSGDGVSSPWHIFKEFHKNDGASAPGPTSSKMELGQTAMINKVLGSQSPGTTTIWWSYATDQVQSPSNGVGGSTGPILGTPEPIVKNHWYDSLHYFEFQPNSTGYSEWWLDGIKRTQGNYGNIPQRSDTVVPGLSFQAGIYRDNAVGGTHGNETIYIALMASGPTRASVGA
jgi:hypothetical protein